MDSIYETYYIKIQQSTETQYVGSSCDFESENFTGSSIDEVLAKAKDVIEDITWKYSSENKEQPKPLSLTSAIKTRNNNELIYPITIPVRHYTLPEKLYLYCPMNEYLPEMLDSPYIWFSDPGRFNDPFELPNVLSMDGTPDELFRDFRMQYVIHCEKEGIEFSTENLNALYLNIVSNDPKELDKVFELKKKTLETVMARNVISYFSRTYDNVLMWSHYTNKHNGVVIGYSYENLSKVGNHGGDVDYRSHKDLIPIGSLPLDPDEQENNPIIIEYLKRTVLTKNPAWAYEQEYRFVKQGEEGKVNIPKDSIKEIYFGLRMKPTNKKMLISLVKDRDVDLYDMTITDDFKLKRVRI